MILTMVGDEYGLLLLAKRPLAHTKTLLLWCHYRNVILAGFTNVYHYNNFFNS